jgi:hypothetical protein
MVECKYIGSRKAKHRKSETTEVVLPLIIDKYHTYSYAKYVVISQDIHVFVKKIDYSVFF